MESRVTSSSLHEAVINANIHEIRILLSEGADVNQKQKTGWENTPLHFATRNICDDSKILKLLLKSGADVNIKNNRGQIALQYATELSDIRIAKILVKAGSDVNSINNWKRTALHYAALNKNTIMVDYLLSSGAEVNVKDVDNETPLHKAAVGCKGESHLKTIEILLSNAADINAKNKSGITPLHYLVKKGNVKSVEFLVNFGADINFPNNEGEIPLHNAIRFGNIKVAQLLIKLGSNVNNVNTRSGSTPLHLACYYCHEKLIKCLMKSGSNVDARNSKELTPLMCMCMNGKLHPEKFIRVLPFLLEYADVNCLDPLKNNIMTSYLPQTSEKIILEHIAKLQILNLPVDLSMLENISSQLESRYYFEKCKNELVLAKNTKIYMCWVSLFNLLVDGKRELKKYAGNNDLIRAFEKSNCLKKFPIYGYRIQNNLIKGMERQRLFNESAILLSRYLPILNPTHLITTDILDCLQSIKDLKKLCCLSLKRKFPE